MYKIYGPISLRAVANVSPSKWIPFVTEHGNIFSVMLSTNRLSNHFKSCSVLRRLI